MEGIENKPVTENMNSLRNHILVSTFILLISAFLFITPEFFGSSEDAVITVFFINYLIAIIYFLLIRFGLKKTERALSHYIFTVLLFLISAYSLNREMAVFLESVDWQSALLILIGIAMIAACFFNVLSLSINLIISFILGISAVLFFYLACYIAPLYLISVPLLLALGISIHSFVPIMLLIVLWKIVSKMKAHNSLNFMFFLGGISFSLMTILVFCIAWAKLNNETKLAYNQHNSLYTQSYPSWITLAQRLPDDWLTKRFLKTRLVYAEGEEMMRFMPDLNFNSFNEKRVHDPLVLIAQLIGKENIEDSDKIKILETMHNARHQAQEQYWRGDRLSTSNIVTNVRIFPAYRLAYTEKTLDIHYKSKNSWDNPQEAIYTFYLPEGGVATSLSLWINGKEEKGYLTTKAKADSAYKTIVSVEARDPSVVHWQEGNMISVRIFPCTAEADRKVKIGFTTPLLLKDDALIYQSIYFKGATPKEANETIKVKIDGYAGKEIDFPFTFKTKPDDFYVYEGNFKPYWEIGLEAIPLEKTQFSFNGKSYKVQSYQKKYENITFKEVYLDLNNSWSLSEIKEVLEIAKNQKIYCWNDYKMLEINQQNVSVIYDEISQYNFSLFPIYQIKNPEKALIITKSEKPSPNLKDLKASPFADALVSYLPKHTPIYLFSLGENLASYLKTLKELKELHYEIGTIDDLKSLVDKKQFLLNQENENTVIIESAQMKIEETAEKTTQKSVAPDHLLRLFAYNSLMKKISANYFKENYITEASIDEAKTAYIVSPVSSLVVLETQEDYKRFDITKSKNSLGNASMNSEGAVPEPEEWALILLSLAFIAYISWKKWKSLQSIA